MVFSPPGRFCPLEMMMAADQLQISESGPEPVVKSAGQIRD